MSREFWRALHSSVASQPHPFGQLSHIPKTVIWNGGRMLIMTMIRILFSLVIFLHGLIHMLGFVKEWNLAEVKLSGVFISFPRVLFKIAGILWLVACSRRWLDESWSWAVHLHESSWLHMESGRKISISAFFWKGQVWKWRRTHAHKIVFSHPGCWC